MSDCIGYRAVLQQYGAWTWKRSVRNFKQACAVKGNCVIETQFNLKSEISHTHAKP